MDSQKQNQRLESIKEEDEYSGLQISEEAEQDKEMEESEESIGLEEETQQLLEQAEEEREEQEEEIQTPPSVRTSSCSKRSLSSLPWSKSRVYDFQNDVSQPKVRRKRRSKVKFQEDLFPDWVVQLMFNIEEATQHELVVE